ncbi:hypothetical protein [Burkholderia sp. L27(2015)]|uniref:hypothetical protein n=1 Tax=Burkholderia sp. L27(2015) TaxID=1641858 RepID=UPI00349EA2AB
MGTLDDSTMTAKRLLRGRRMVVGTPRYFAEAGIPKTPAGVSRTIVAFVEHLLGAHGGGTEVDREFTRPSA